MNAYHYDHPDYDDVLRKDMTPIDKLVRIRLLNLIRRDRNLVRERQEQLVSDVLDRNARAYERLKSFREAEAVRESLGDVIDAMRREVEREEVVMK